MMKCKKCGKKILVGEFCWSCINEKVEEEDQEDDIPF